MSAERDDRLAVARARVEDATRAARTARIAAADPLRERARRRTRHLRIGVAVVGVLAVAVGAVAIGLAVHNRAAAERSAAADDALAASRTAITTLLTADPADPAGYVDHALAVTTGDQHERLATARDALAAEIGAQERPSSGQVLSAGLVTDPPSDDVGAEATVLMVAEATDPQLVGGDRQDSRVTVEVTMTRTDSGWSISSAGMA
ncbi:hypothetical protein [Gordonia insulae]|uniref:Mce-associated membrane protein n=1 Tax=Gordonia insulae TaxID=2420509 RepID=A0A3G8JVU3_9ACTN|nr:hypothetical protein [Gordonia insulae]AZG48300.1 hypothetical protein D7316_04917 [Gordonia insulae]